jgi:glycosyltransferase involved in cell wall biosynthesis
MTTRIALFVGGATAPNVQLTAGNFGRILQSEFEVDLVGTEINNFDTSVFDKTIGQEFSQTWSGQVQALDSYLASVQNATIVQITRPPDYGTIAGILAHKHDVPFVYRYSGDKFYEHRVMQGTDRFRTYFVNNILGRVPLWLADRYIVLGPCGHQRLVSRGVSDDKIVQLPPPINPDRCKDVANEELDIPTGTPIAAFVGRLSRLKGVELLRSAIPTILEELPKMQFVFIGEGSKSLRLPEKYHDRIHFTGWIHPNQVLAYLREVDLLVHPSLTEGLPRAILEALVCDTPVIARDVGEVSHATDNTFQTESEFIEMVLSYDSLKVDNKDRFTTEALSDRYRKFFRQYE